MTLFKETDDIIRLGKWAYFEIPGGKRCDQCPVLRKYGPDGFGHISWSCGLRPHCGLIYDEWGPLKDHSCPRRG